MLVALFYVWHGAHAWIYQASQSDLRANFRPRSGNFGWPSKQPVDADPRHVQPAAQQYRTKVNVLWRKACREPLNAFRKPELLHTLNWNSFYCR